MIAAIARRYFGLEAGLFTGPLAIGNRDLVQLSIASVVGNTATTSHYVVLVIVAIAMTGLLIAITPWTGPFWLLIDRVYAFDIAIYVLALYQATGQYGEFRQDEARVSELRMANLDGATVAANFMLPETHKWRSFLIILAVVVLFFGATKLPGLARSMGEAQKEFKRGADDDVAPDRSVDERANERPLP